MPGGLEDGGHLPCADPFLARQPGSVLHHQVWRGDALFRQPVADHPLGGLGVVAIGFGAVARADAEEQLLGHGVVTVLVDVADDLHQVRGERPRQQLGVLRHLAEAVLAGDAATQLLPEGADGAGGVARMVEQRHVGLGAAAFRQLAAGDQGGAVELGHRVVAYVGPGRALGGLGHLHPVVDADALDRRLHGQVDLAAFGAGDQAHRLEVDQQRIGADQEGFVVIAAVVIEGGQLRVHEVAAVQHQVAGDLEHAVGAQVTHHQPELFHVQLRVAATLEVEVAVEHAVLQGAVGEELGLPLVGGAEQLQGGVGGDQLHGRRRVHRDIGVDQGLGAGAGEGQGHQGQRSGGDLVGGQGLLHLGGQVGVDLGGLQGQGTGQDQGGERKGTDGLEHQRLPSWRGRVK
ncbi:hypothetical protein D3C80_922950 [compost metagenome]